MTPIKHLLVAALLPVLALPVMAGPGDARDLGDMASNLLMSTQTAHDDAIGAFRFDAPQIDPDFISGLQRFGVLSSQIAADIDAKDGPKDLGCIYRGMAEETDVQLQALSASHTGADQAAALERLISMLDDAMMVSEAAARALSSETPDEGSITVGSCSASPVTGKVTD